MNRSVFAPIVALSVVLAVAGCAGDKKTTKTPPPPPPPMPSPAMPYTAKLSSDALFAFGKSELSGMGPEARSELDALAARIQSAGALDVVHVIGHSDRIGNDKANQALSLKRAQSVRAYLVQRGVAADKITAVGRGSVEPLVPCKTEKAKALIACLAPNRRVDVRVEPAR